MYQNTSSEDKQKLSELADLIQKFTIVGEDMWSQKKDSMIIQKTDLALLLLFRQILEMADALSVLMKEGCVNATKPLVRSLLEYYFQLAYLLEDNEERKSLQVLYHYERGLRDYYENLAIPQKGGSFFERLKNDKHLKGDDISLEQKEAFLDNVKKIDLVLDGDDNKEVAAEYLRTEGKKTNAASGKKGKVGHWYELFDGPTSVEGISVKLKEAALYQFIYRSCSSYAHGEDIIHVNLEAYGEDTYKISPLRDLRQLTIIANNILLLIDLSCNLFLKHKTDDKKYFLERLLPLKQEKRKYYKNNE